MGTVYKNMSQKLSYEQLMNLMNSLNTPTNFIKFRDGHAGAIC